MTTFTVSIPDELKKKLESLPEINWAEYLKHRFELKITQLNNFRKLANAGKI